jgi:tetratricopeptide (TPR) repeat protein
MDPRPQQPQPSPAGAKPELNQRIAEAESRFRESRRRRLALLGGLALAAVMVGLIIRSQAPATLVAQWHLSNAHAKFDEEDFDGALAACDRALALLPEEPDLYQMRAQINQQRGDLPAALEDLNQLLKRNPHFYQGYLQRSFIEQLQGNHDAAIADARKARDWWGNDDPRPLNNLAYALAVANRDLESALKDANQAIKLVKDSRAAASEDAAKSSDGKAPAKSTDGETTDSPIQASDMALSSYLDTRGFVLFRLGQASASDVKQAKTHYQAALADFDEAIRLFTRSKKAILDRLKTQGAAQAREERRLNENLALMYQHRYQAHEAIGEKDKATADQEFASRLGYDPAKQGL